MRIAVWTTPHDIAAAVADAAFTGLSKTASVTCIFNTQTLCPELIQSYDAHIAYGILRGTADVFRECDRLGKPWLHLDRGYWKPGHYDGYYRVSLRGTQQVLGFDKLAPDYDRWRALGVELKPWRGFDDNKPILVCPPTDEARHFFGIRRGWGTPPDNPEWLWYRMAGGGGMPPEMTDMPKPVLRLKGDPIPINFSDYNYVVTFNSSVGWQALAAGIPCISDPAHSIVGAWFAESLTDSLAQNHVTLAERQYKEREKLFAVMSALQLTLDEIRAGKLWELTNLLLPLSASIPASRNAVTSPPTASSAAPTSPLTSAI